MRRKLRPNGQWVSFDACDAKLLEKYSWYVDSNGYARAHIGEGKCVYMHRIIMGAKKGIDVDHINHNKLNNKRSNLRCCKHQHNTMNKIIQTNNTSGFKGVYWARHANRYMAYVTIDRNNKYLGYFDNKEDAALAYDMAALMLYREFALLNFKEVLNESK